MRMYFSSEWEKKAVNFEIKFLPDKKHTCISELNILKEVELQFFWGSTSNC